MRKTIMLFALILLGLNTSPAHVFNNAVKFYSARNTYITIPAACLSGVTNQLTLEAWVNPDAAFTTARIIDHSTPGASDGLLLDLYNGTPRVIIGSVGVSSSTALSAGTWYHLAATYDGSTIRLYLNGALENFSLASGSVPNNPAISNVRIGNDQANGNIFSGLIDEVRIWKTALTKSYIMSTMSTSLNGTEHGLAGYWPFQESDPTVTTVDYTSNGNNGTLVHFSFDGNDGFVINPLGLALSPPNTPITLGGSGSNADPYQIGSYTDLTAVGAPYEVNAVYKLTADINASASASGDGYQPIGDYNMPFIGTFHGSGHTITSLHIVRGSTDYVGLFGCLAVAGLVDSLGLESVDITGAMNTGGLAGRLSGTVSESYVTGVINGTEDVGGFAGIVDGGTVNNCYAIASVTGSNDVGGFAGVASATFTHCYATGSVSGSTNTDAFLGYVDDPIVTGCFYNSAVVPNGVAGTGKTASQMKKNLIYAAAGWSSAVWNRDDGTNDDYPYLKWQAPGGTPLSSPFPAANVALWLRADKGLTRMDLLVSSWADQSGNGNDAVQSTTSNQPVLALTGLNGKPVLGFNGSTSQMMLPTSTALGIQNGPYEFFIVARSGFAAGPEFLISGDLYENYEYHLNAGARFIPCGGIYIDKIESFADGNAHVFAARASAAGGAVRVDGIDGGTVSSDVHSSVAGNLHLGSRQGVNYFLNGDIAEVIIYTTNLSPADRYTVEHYLADRYGITSGALSVELSSFTAAPSAGGAMLKWKTATETNNSGFAVERRTATSGWTELGFVKGAGTSTSPKEYSYKDTKISGGSYDYRLKQIDNGGAFKYSGEATLTIEVPRIFALEQNYPNPFNPSTTISFTLAEDSHVSLKIFDIMGREVRTLVEGNLKAGEVHSAVFDASGLSSGSYFYRLQTNTSSQLKKLVLLK